MNKFTSLLLFYTTGPFNGCVCLSRENAQILKIPRVCCNSKNVKSNIMAEFMLGAITNINKWPIPLYPADIKEYEDEIDIIYMGILEGRQELTEGYEWIKISDLDKLGISEKDLETIRSAGVRRF